MTDLRTDLSTQKALSRPSSSLPASVSDIMDVCRHKEDDLPQIIAEALIALIMFLPGTALSMAPLKDVTYRGELSSR